MDIWVATQMIRIQITGRQNERILIRRTTVSVLRILQLFVPFLIGKENLVNFASINVILISLLYAYTNITTSMKSYKQNMFLSHAIRCCSNQYLMLLSFITHWSSKCCWWSANNNDGTILRWLVFTNLNYCFRSK